MLQIILTVFLHCIVLQRCWETTATILISRNCVAFLFSHRISMSKKTQTKSNNTLLRTKHSQKKKKDGITSFHASCESHLVTVETYQRKSVLIRDNHRGHLCGFLTDSYVQCCLFIIRLVQNNYPNSDLSASGNSLRHIRCTVSAFFTYRLYVK